ncbi:UNVERIFIED_CONTAM: hypothetical protein FKN15_021567 [Acipenser sinensis]
MCIFFLTDQSKIYTMVYEGGNDSIFRGTWIGLFTGLAYFCTSILGMYCIMKSKRILLLVFVPNMFLKQMLRRYNKPLPDAVPSSLDEIYMTSGITHSWNRFMTECLGITLSAMCIFFLTDQSKIYTMVYEGGNDSIFRGTWIGLFTGLAYFCTSILGMYCIMKSKRILLLVFVPNMFLKQMLRRYNKPLPDAVPSSLDEIYMTSGITHSWNRFMTENQCCGVYGPQDWFVVIIGAIYYYVKLDE